MLVISPTFPVFVWMYSVVESYDFAVLKKSSDITLASSDGTGRRDIRFESDGSQYYGGHDETFFTTVTVLLQVPTP